MPDIEGRGFKVAHDKHGHHRSGSRRPPGLARRAGRGARLCLAERLPALAGAQLNEERVCQYENSSNGDLLIDRHPTAPNALWVVQVLGMDSSAAGIQGGIRVSCCQASSRRWSRASAWHRRPSSRIAPYIESTPLAAAGRQYRFMDWQLVRMSFTMMVQHLPGEIDRIGLGLTPRHSVVATTTRSSAGTT